MKTFGLVLVAALVLVVWAKVHRQKASTGDGLPTRAQAESVNGWAQVPMPAGTHANRVIVFSALNCPKPAAQRALSIMRDLEDRGVPCDHVDRIEFPGATPDEGARLQRVIDGGGPVVFVKGRAKSAPLVDEILAEYARN